MPINALIILIVVFLLTSMVGVVTGSNSLISVPVMFQFGVDPKVAVATNMFGLVFMGIGGTIPFIKKRTIDYVKISPYIVLNAGRFGDRCTARRSRQLSGDKADRLDRDDLRCDIFAAEAKRRSRSRTQTDRPRRADRLGPGFPAGHLRRRL